MESFRLVLGTESTNSMNWSSSDRFANQISFMASHGLILRFLLFTVY